MPLDSYYTLMSQTAEADRVYEFDIPPSANRYWRNFRGHMVISKEAKEYKTHVASKVTFRDRHDPAHKGGGIFEGRIGVRLLYMLSDYRRFDLDNRVKVLLDALQGQIYKDDQQVFSLFAQKVIQPRIEGGVKPVERVIVYIFDGTKIGDIEPSEITMKRLKRKIADLRRVKG